MAGQTDENRLHVLRHAAFTARDVREMERPLLENGVPLMRMASAATAHVVAEMLEDEGVALEESNIVLLAGSGDNGGDGLRSPPSRSAARCMARGSPHSSAPAARC